MDDEKDDKDDEDKAKKEIRSRRIGALKDKISSRREQLKLKMTQRVSFVNMKTTIDTKGIESHNGDDGLGSVVTGVSQVGSDNALGGALAAGAGMWSIISSAMDDAEQKGEVLTAKQAIDRQLVQLDGEIAALNSEIATLERELDDLFMSGD